MGAEVKGRRVYPDAAGQLPKLEPGDYGRYGSGEWYCCAPVDTGDWFTNFHGSLGSGTSHHQVAEHEDGTITVSPSILIKRHNGEWHGFLERGVWRSC